MRVRDNVAYTLMAGVAICLVIVIASRNEVVDRAAGLMVWVIVGIAYASARWLNNESPSICRLGPNAGSGRQSQDAEAVRDA